MPLVKRLEWLMKVLLALLLAALSWRPGRAARARRRLEAPRRVLLVRLDHRVGEVLLTTPLISALAAHRPDVEVHCLVHPKMVRVLEGHPGVAGLHAFHRRQLWWGPWAPFVRGLRRQAFDAVVNCGNWEAVSVTSAAVARLVGGSAAVVGPANFPSGLLMDVGVEAKPAEPSEALQRLHLLSALGLPEEAPRFAFRTPRPTEPVRAFAGALGRPHAVVNPGGRLGERRVPTSVFSAGARALAGAGAVPIVTWGPGEEALADEVCAGCPDALRAPPTSLDDLAFLMQGARLTLCNNTGPMHLAAAVGSPMLALFFRMDVARWGYRQAPHRMLDVTAQVLAGEDVGAVVAAAVAQALAARSR